MKTLHTKDLLAWIVFICAIVLFSISISFAQSTSKGKTEPGNQSVNPPYPIHLPPTPMVPPNPVPNPDPGSPVIPIDTIKPVHGTGRMGGGINTESVNSPINDLQLTNLSIYPNPSNGQFTLNFNSDLKGDVQVRITDILGKEIFSQQFGDFNGDFNQLFDLTNKGRGIYILSIEQNNELLTKRIIVS